MTVFIEKSRNLKLTDSGRKQSGGYLGVEGGVGGLPRGLMSFPGDEHHSLDCGDSFMSVSVYPLILYIGLSCVPFIK